MKKIMFNDKYGLTDAVLEGRKTMTRRIVPQSVVDNYMYDTDPTIIDAARFEIGEVVAIAQSYKSIFEKSLNYALPRYHWLDDHIDDWDLVKDGSGNVKFYPAWSLVALLNVIPLVSLSEYNGAWSCDYYNKERHNYVFGKITGNPIDACYELVLKLHEQNIL